jgi:hypothetical protein
MSLGLLARDSIVDLAAFNREDVSSAASLKDTIEAPTTSATANTGIANATRRISVRNHSRTTSQKEANPQQPPSLQFSGLLDDYYSDEYYNFDDDDETHKPHFLLGSGGGGTHSSSNYNLGGGHGGSNKFLCCLFPWLLNPPKKKLNLQHSISTDNGHHGKISPLPSEVAISNDNDTESKDGESTNSNVLGERLSDRERQAVLARLRLAQPESVTASSQQHQNETRNETKDTTYDESSVRNGKPRRKGLLNGFPVQDSPTQGGTPPKLKGILKTRSSTKVDEQTQPTNVREARLSTIGEPQATLDVRTSTGGGGTRRRSLFPSYEDKKPRTSNSVSFSPMARVVTVKSRNDMTLEEKSDIWWQKNDYEDFRKTGRIITKAMLEGGGEIWLTGGSSPTATSKKRNEGKSESAETGDKWWHKFGHSRRGLEHVVSIEEGRQRQMNVKTAIRAVLDEQARQKMYKREDAEKLRHVALHHTMWARDLALASGASDADAVDQSFSEGRKSREFFLLKMSRNKAPTGSVKLDPKNVPLFMQPALNSRPSSTRIGTNIATHHLDAHTASQIQFRRQKLQPDLTLSMPERELESQEQVHDPNPDETSKASLAQKAAGFSADHEKVNMAAVLSGMGGALLNQKNETLPVMRVAS